MPQKEHRGYVWQCEGCGGTLNLYGGAHDATAPVATGQLHGVSVATGRRDLLGVSCIWTAARIAVLTEPWLLAVHPATGREEPGTAYTFYIRLSRQAASASSSTGSSDRSTFLE